MLSSIADNFDSYRRHCGFSHLSILDKEDLPQIDETFRSILPPSADKFFTLLEKVIFSNACNDTLKSAVSGGKRTIDIVTMGRIKD